VEYGSSEEAQKAIDQFHNKEFQGRAITVNVARPREERPARFGGGGGGERSDYRGGERRERR
ncbi:MAG TPA: RNA-binding protein, partial [Verrucomicrobiae bacterium]